MDDATLKVDWAETHIEELDSSLNAFLETSPYKVLPKRDPKSKEIRYYLAEKRDVPSEIRLLTGDILQNLRTALDYAVCALVENNGGRITGGTGFPVFDESPSTPEDEARLLGKMKGARDEVIDYVRAVKPYKTTNYAIWRLHRLNIIDKHRLLLTAGLAMTEINLGQHMRATRAPDPLRFTDDMWVAPRNFLVLHNVGDDLFADPHTVEVNENIELKFAVALDEPQVGPAEPVIQIVRQSLDWVTGIVCDLAVYLR